MYIYKYDEMVKFNSPLINFHDYWEYLNNIVKEKKTAENITAIKNLEIELRTFFLEAVIELSYLFDKNKIEVKFINGLYLSAILRPGIKTPYFFCYLDINNSFSVLISQLNFNLDQEKGLSVLSCNNFNFKDIGIHIKNASVFVNGLFEEHSCENCNDSNKIISNDEEKKDLIATNKKCSDEHTIIKEEYLKNIKLSDFN